jgi:histidinol-phosphate aminotransferase
LASPLAVNAELIYLALRKQGILVRYFKQSGLEDKLRISVGTNEQNQILVKALGSLINNNRASFFPNKT